MQERLRTYLGEVDGERGLLRSGTERNRNDARHSRRSGTAVRTKHGCVVGCGEERTTPSGEGQRLKRETQRTLSATDGGSLNQLLKKERGKQPNSFHKLSINGSSPSPQTFSRAPRPKHTGSNRSGLAFLRRVAPSSARTLIWSHLTEINKTDQIFVHCVFLYYSVSYIIFVPIIDPLHHLPSQRFLFPPVQAIHNSVIRRFFPAT